MKFNSEQNLAVADAYKISERKQLCEALRQREAAEQVLNRDRNILEALAKR